MFNTNPDQTNTRPAGPFAVLAGENLTGKRSHLVVLTHDTGVPEVKLPTGNNDLALHLLNEEGVDAALVAVEPLAQGGPSRRIKLKDTCEPGDVLVLADTAGAEKGKVRKLPATAGVYVQIGISEEHGVDTQHVLVRPFLKVVVVASVVAAPAAATSTDGVAAAAADLAALKAEAELIGDDVRALRTKVAAIHTALVANGQLVIA